jgi:hypothetical protein
MQFRAVPRTCLLPICSPRRSPAGGGTPRASVHQRSIAEAHDAAARGAALPEEGDQNDRMSHVFLSYSRSDRDLAGQLRADLLAGGLDVWSDRRLGLGGRWLAEISTAISGSQAVVLLATPAALKSKWVMREIDAAQTLGKPVVPILAEGSRFGDLPVNLAGINGIDLADGYEESVTLVVATLSSLDSLDVTSLRLVGARCPARTLLLLTVDADVAAVVKEVSRSVGLVVERPEPTADKVFEVAARAHVAVIDGRAHVDAAFLAGYVAGRGGWVLCLTGTHEWGVPAAHGVKRCLPHPAELEREICSAAFLPAGVPGS